MVRFVGNKQSKYVNLALCEFSASKGEKLTYVLASIKLGKSPCLSTMWLNKAMRDYFVRYTLRLQDFQTAGMKIPELYNFSQNLNFIGRTVF